MNDKNTAGFKCKSHDKEVSRRTVEDAEADGWSIVYA